MVLKPGILVGHDPAKTDGFSAFLKNLAESIGLKYSVLPGALVEGDNCIYSSCLDGAGSLLSLLLKSGFRNVSAILYSPENNIETFSAFHKIEFPVLIVSRKGNGRETHDGWFYHDNISGSSMFTVECPNGDIWTNKPSQCISLTRKFLSNVYEGF